MAVRIKSFQLLLICSQVNEIPGILVFQFNSPLFFANADVFRARLMLALGLSLDGAADDDGSGKKDEAKDGSCFQRCCSKVCINNHLCVCACRVIHPLTCSLTHCSKTLFKLHH